MRCRRLLQVAIELCRHYHMGGQPDTSQGSPHNLWRKASLPQNSGRGWPFVGKPILYLNCLNILECLPIYLFYFYPRGTLEMSDLGRNNSLGSNGVIDPLAVGVRMPPSQSNKRELKSFHWLLQVVLAQKQCSYNQLGGQPRKPQLPVEEP